MKKDWSSQEIIALRRMLRAGKTHADIAQELKRSASSVKNKANSQAAFSDQPVVRQRHCA